MSIVHRFEGCQHFTCDRCKHEFCWVCLSDYRPSDAPGKTPYPYIGCTSFTCRRAEGPRYNFRPESSFARNVASLDQRVRAFSAAAQKREEERKREEQLTMDFLKDKLKTCPHCKYVGVYLARDRTPRCA